MKGAEPGTAGRHEVTADVHHTALRNLWHRVAARKTVKNEVPLCLPEWTKSDEDKRGED